MCGDCFSFKMFHNYSVFFSGDPQRYILTGAQPAFDLGLKICGIQFSPRLYFISLHFACGVWGAPRAMTITEKWLLYYSC